MKLKLDWLEFVAKAMVEIRREHPTAEAPEFRNSYVHEPDGDVYDFPSYVEISIGSKENLCTPER